MKKKIKLGIPIENEATGETNIILRTNEIRIIEEAFEEIERLKEKLKFEEATNKELLSTGAELENKLYEEQDKNKRLKKNL